MNEAMKLTEEPEPTAFLEKSRTMISKGMNLKKIKVIKLISTIFQVG